LCHLWSIPRAHSNGHVTLWCVYDEDCIYFLLEVPGTYQFESTDVNASILTMFEMDSDAMLYVDIGGHWELTTTKMGIKHGIRGSSGLDTVSRKHGAYYICSICGIEDNNANDTNEWKGA
ncbi:hypothetical protein ACHAWX_003146, partial [Stephanocyclus meneghinianus]